MAAAVFLLGLGHLQAQAAVLTVCSDQPASVLEQPAEGYRNHVLQPDGRVTVLHVAHAPRPVPRADCAGKDLPVEAGILWAGLVPAMPDATRRITLQGSPQPDGFAVSEIILAQPAQGQPQLDSAALPEPAALPAAPRSTARAGWYWSPALWLETPQKIFDSAEEHKLKRIYITVLVEDDRVKHAEELAAFIAQAGAHGLSTWAVLGDPAAVLPAGRRHFAAMAGAYAAYNQGAGEKARLGGLQLDIEPYLLPGYQLDPQAWQSRYVETIAAIHAAAPQLALDLALPFWWGATEHGGEALLDRLAGAVSGITVMDYRTEPDEIKRFARPFLRWGSERGKAVSIALEALPIADEERRTYFRAEQGELLHIALDQHQLLVLLAAPARVEGARSYRFSHGGAFKGSSISFAGRTGQLTSLLPTLEDEFSRWPSFSGMALHGLQ